MEAVARQVRLAAGSDFVANNDGAEWKLGILKTYFAPDVVDSVRQEVARFLQLKRTDQTMGDYLVGSIRRAARRNLGYKWVGFPQTIFVDRVQAERCAVKE